MSDGLFLREKQSYNVAMLRDCSTYNCLTFNAKNFTQPVVLVVINSRFLLWAHYLVLPIAHYLVFDPVYFFSLTICVVLVSPTPHSSTSYTRQRKV